MSDSRAWPIRPKWHRYETPKSYAHRQSLAVGVPFRDVERGLTSPEHPLVARVWLDSVEAARTVEAAAGRTEGHYLRLLHAAQPHPAQLYPARFLCRLCAAGDVVEQIPHDRENWCTKHPGQMVWAGPGTTPDTQVIHPFDKRQAKAERAFRRLATAGLISARLHARVWEMVRDNASLSQPSGWSDALQGHREEHETRGRAELFPATVTVLETLSNEALVARWIGLSSDDLRPAIRAAFDALDGQNDVLVERIVLWLRRHRREIRPTRIDPLNVPLDLVDVASIIDTKAAYPLWIQRRPAAVSEWDWDANDLDRDPLDNVGTSVKAQWVCDEGHTWTATPYVRAIASCPYCAGQSVWRGQSDLETLFPALADEWDRAHGVNAGGPDTVSAGSRRRINWVCRDGHRWVSTIKNRARKGSGCPYCAGNLAIRGETDLASRRPDLLAEWDFASNADVTPDLVGAGSARRVGWKGTCGHMWKARIVDRTAGSGCPRCSRRPTPGVNNLATTRPDLAEQWHPDNTLPASQIHPKSSTKARWRCGRNHTWEATPYTRSVGHGCPFCSNRRASPGETDLATLRPDLLLEWHDSNFRRPQELTLGSRYRAVWECRLGHRWEAAVSKRTGKSGTGCPRCCRSNSGGKRS
jgi:hypothetical protein